MSKLAFTVTTLVARACVRCSHTLEDPASVQAGIGPVCRRLANEILAKELPTAWDDGALAAFFLLGPESFAPEAMERFLATYQRVLTSKGANATGPVQGEDMRAAVRELAYLASVALSRAALEAVLGAIRGVGYPTYAAFVSGESATGEASLAFVRGEVQLQAVKNAAGGAALRRLGAWRDHAAGLWLAPASKAEAIIAAVRVYWPLVTGAEETLAAVKAALAPVAIRVEGSVFYLRSPYDARFVAALKASVPPFARAFDGESKSWRIARRFEGTVRALLAEYYPSDGIAVVAA